MSVAIPFLLRCPLKGVIQKQLPLADIGSLLPLCLLLQLSAVSILFEQIHDD